MDEEKGAADDTSKVEGSECKEDEIKDATKNVMKVEGTCIAPCARTIIHRLRV